MSTPRRVGPSAERAQEIVRILALEDPTAEQLERIGVFISLLGWDRVRQAADYTAGRRKRFEISDPWYYMIGVINHNTARASYLFTLIHWIELAFRAGCDSALAERFVADWHLIEPAVYLDERGLGNLWKTYEAFQARQAAKSYTVGDERPAVLWRPGSDATTWIPNYQSPEAFLAALDFEPLTQIVLHLYSVREPRAEPILFAGAGQMPHHVAREELRWLRKFVRNVVAHHHPPELAALGESVFDLNDFIATAARTERVLVALRYNAAPALARHELMRFTVIDDAVRRLGAKEGLQALIGSVRKGTAAPS